MDFRKKVVLITGAAHGIGEAFARSFYKRGARLILVDVNEEKLKKVFSTITADKGEHLYLVKDLADYEQRQSIYDDLKARNIEIDVLVNNVGIGYRGYLCDTPWKKIENVIDVNIKSTVHLTWLFLPQMKKKNNGGVINVSSTGAFCGADVGSVYTGTKAFITNFTEGLSMELFDTGVQATAAHPGATDTNFWAASGWVDSSYNKKIKMMSPEDTADEFIRAFSRKKASIIAGRRNRRMVFLSKFIPREMLKRMAVNKYK